MNKNSREAIIAKYTDKSRYKPEHIYGNVYVDELRIAQSKKSEKAKNDHERELKAAIRFSKHFDCEVFLLPEGDENGNVIYVGKHSNPDSIIKGYFIDLKKTKGTDSSITRRLEHALKQADGVLITIEIEILIDKAVQWINGKLNSMKSRYDGFIIVIEDNMGDYITYTVNKKRLSKKENLFMAARQLSPSDPESGNPQVD